MKKNFLSLSCFCAFCAILTTATAWGQTNYEQVNLFSKTDLSQWDFHSDQSDAKVNEVYSFSDNGILTCKGKPFGWLGTKEEYKNFKLSVEYRWSENIKPTTNSGIFLRINNQPEKTFLPRGVEIQLAPKRAGDLYGFHGMKLPAPENAAKDRISTRDGGEKFGHVNGLKKIADLEKEAGQWNSLDILCDNGLIVVVFNGKIVNWATDAEQIAGKIGFQSEGGQVEFRNAIIHYRR
ncbi:MAG: DUF1080 domain-containing protein [Planctomycetaceae bacterium]|jgi:hypothetical protein|nr:DUF1080 domain-containing protein [Planctomycetaceae bacterium]